MDYQFLKIEQQEAITIVKISAPKSLNALNSTLLGELGDFVDKLDTRATRVLIITGDGDRSFVAGADISEMATLNEEQGLAFGKLGAEVFRKIELLPIPVIAAVNGFALGGGCELTMACDIRVASSKAKFGQPEVGLGIIPGFSGTVRLPRLVGPGLAKELIYTGRTVRADEAHAIGLVNSVCEPEELMPRVLDIAAKMLTNAPIAIALAKQSIGEGSDMSIDDAIAHENRLFAKCFATADQKEGMAAFLDKRKADFRNQ